MRLGARTPRPRRPGWGSHVSELHYDEWMSESDSVLWHIERDPLLRSTITSVWFLDSAPDRARMDAVVDRIVAKIPRLHQRVVDEQPGVAPPRWADDPHVDVDYHYSWARLPGPTGEPPRRLGPRATPRRPSLRQGPAAVGAVRRRGAPRQAGGVHHEGAPRDRRRPRDGAAAATHGRPRARSRPTTPSRPTAAAVPPEVADRLRIEAPVWAIPGARSLAHRVAIRSEDGRPPRQGVTQDRQRSAARPTRHDRATRPHHQLDRPRGQAGDRAAQHGDARPVDQHPFRGGVDSVRRRSRLPPDRRTARSTTCSWRSPSTRSSASTTPPAGRVARCG